MRFVPEVHEFADVTGKRDDLERAWSDGWNARVRRGARANPYDVLELIDAWDEGWEECNLAFIAGNYPAGSSEAMWADAARDLRGGND